MRFPDLIPAEFIWRDNRFTAAVRLDGKITRAHIANSGRLPGLFIPDGRVWLTPVDKPNRKTKFDLKLVEMDGSLISVDARLPNPLFAEALREKQLGGFVYKYVQPEAKLGKSRMDFRLSNDDEVCWVETKSVTLVENRIAMFPDAPTARGRRHLQELAESVINGDQAAVVFVVQRSDAEQFMPNTSIDPEFTQELINAVTIGVVAKAFLCNITMKSIKLMEEIPVIL